MEPQQNKSSIGSIIGTIIIIALIILGGLYFWGKRLEESKATQDALMETTQNVAVEPITTSQNEAMIINSMTSSDDLNSIEADLKATNLDNLDQEINIQ